MAPSKGGERYRSELGLDSHDDPRPVGPVGVLEPQVAGIEAAAGAGVVDHPQQERVEPRPRSGLDPPAQPPPSDLERHAVVVGGAAANGPQRGTFRGRTQWLVAGQAAGEQEGRQET